MAGEIMRETHLARTHLMRKPALALALMLLGPAAAFPQARSSNPTLPGYTATWRVDPTSLREGQSVTLEGPDHRFFSLVVQELWWSEENAAQRSTLRVLFRLLEPYDYPGLPLRAGSMLSWHTEVTRVESPSITLLEFVEDIVSMFRSQRQFPQEIRVAWDRIITPDGLIWEAP